MGAGTYTYRCARVSRLCPVCDPAPPSVFLPVQYGTGTRYCTEQYMYRYSTEYPVQYCTLLTVQYLCARAQVFVQALGWEFRRRLSLQVS